MLKEQLQEFFSCEELSTELLECHTADEAKNVIYENGVDITDEEMDVLREYLSKFVENDGQLSEEDLEQVSGGWSVAGIVSAPARVAFETLTAVFLAPAEGITTAVVGFRNKMRELTNSGNTKKEASPQAQTPAARSMPHLILPGTVPVAMPPVASWIDK